MGKCPFKLGILFLVCFALAELWNESTGIIYFLKQMRIAAPASKNDISLGTLRSGVGMEDFSHASVSSSKNSLEPFARDSGNKDRNNQAGASADLAGNVSESLEKSMPTSKNTSFVSYEWETLPNFVCMKNAVAFTTKEIIEKEICDGQTYRLEINPPTGTVVWRPALLLTWFTCEGNLHHFMTDTLHPIVHTLDISNFEEPPLLGVVASVSLSRWKANETGCHGGTYYPLFSAYNVDPVMFSFPNSHHRLSDHKDLDDEGCVYPGPNERWQLPKTYCFNHTVEASRREWSPSVVPGLLAWAGCMKDPSSGIRVAIVQRLRTRRILNADNLVLAAAPLVEAVSVVYLEDMSVQEQIRSTACGSVILAGVQGAGLQWATLMGQDGARAGLIEWVWRSWDTNYAGRVSLGARGIVRTIEDANVHEPCPVPRGAGCCCPSSDAACDEGPCAFPTKNVDITVDVNAWQQDLLELIAHIRP